MKLIVVPLLLGFVAFTVLAQSDDVTSSSILSDIQYWNASCSPKDSCRLDKGSRISDLPDLDKRNCLCDDVCGQFGDCCPDSKRFSPHQQQLASDRFTCHFFKQYKYNWIVDKCPNGWTDAQVAQSCQTEPEDSQIHRDPIGHMPVTSTVSGITYRNMHCAICNGDTPTGHHDIDRLAQLRFWNPRLECTSILSGSSFINQTSNKTLASMVQWNETEKLWGIMADINDGRGEQFRSCDIDPSLPDDVQPYLRPCQLSIGDCPSDWEDEDIKQKCLAYTSFVYDTVSAQREPHHGVYRNVHCAICNGVQLSSLLCNASVPSFRNVLPNTEFSPYAFALLFDLKDSDGSGIVGQRKKCLEGQLYDPFSQKCRQVYCSQAGTVYREGRCLQDATSSTTTSTTSSILSTTSSTISSTTEYHGIVFPDDEETETVHPDLVATTSTIGSKEPSDPATIRLSTTTLGSNQEELATTTSSPANVSNNGQDSGLETDLVSCPKFLLDANEVEWRENGTLYVPSRDKTYQSGQYQKEEDGRIGICAHGTNMISKFDAILGWVTVAGLGLSEVCLALHLIAFIISPELRNLSGRNLASLSLALFAAYGSFIAQQFVPVSRTSHLCIGIALSTFYFFLSAFFWTSVLAWDVWRTIRLATVQLRCSSSGQQWGKFVLYSLYAWLVPGLIVAAAVVVDFVDVGATPLIPMEYHPHFGHNVCWIGQRQALLIYFAVPLAAILFVNLLLFISSTYMIRSTTAKSPTSNNQASLRKQLGLYVRLALIMGLSWIAGLIAGAADFMPLWYVFVALCSLQGVFILLAYTCNPKVARSIRNRIVCCRTAGQRRQSTYRTALVSGLKGEHLRRLGLEARDSHDSQVSNTSQASQTSQTSLTKTSSNSSTSP